MIMLPCAGGTSMMFQQVIHYLPKGISGHALDYSGHGRRVQKPLYQTMDEITEDLLQEMVKLNLLTGEDYGVMGYSMGSAISYELTRKIAARGLPLPTQLFLCASPPVSKQLKTKKKWSSQELYDYLLQLGGTDKALLDNQEFQDYYFPIIEADLNVLQQYEAKSGSKLSVPVTVLYGSTDQYRKEEMMTWHLFFEKCRFYEVQGGHFFINEQPLAVANLISKGLMS